MKQMPENVGQKRDMFIIPQLTSPVWDDQDCWYALIQPENPGKKRQRRENVQKVEQIPGNDLRIHCPSHRINIPLYWVYTVYA